jgi:aerobic-type carbon monoxide dehydrogenase small subunit (CoxS/CutS family)|tara:strand:+ start:82 stop:564 length:483 start_codon:yes stop_codon:yes gene_type:complete
LLNVKKLKVFEINVNNKILKVEADPSTPLLWILRDNLNLVGTKYGCGISQCGACTVHLNGDAIRSCVYPISAVGKQKITTIEGLSKEGELSYVQEAWINKDVSQCGYCQAGQIMTATALLEKINDPSDDEIDKAMSGNICRCGTYTRIKKAIKSASSNKK